MLIAWDSPLTGPVDPDGALRDNGQDLTQRPIESFFRSHTWGYKAPKGISVLPYCGCPHWTISQRILGLPKVGSHSPAYDKLPFRLVFGKNERSKADVARASIVEVHPAVAIWLWCCDADIRPDSWKYKNNPAKVRELWQLICGKVEGAQELPAPTNDDQLDSVVAWLLAERWIKHSDVVLLGDQRTGSFLVPKSEALLGAFDRFLRATGSHEAT